MRLLCENVAFVAYCERFRHLKILGFDVFLIFYAIKHRHRNSTSLFVGDNFAFLSLSLRNVKFQTYFVEKKNAKCEKVCPAYIKPLVSCMIVFLRIINVVNTQINTKNVFSFFFLGMFFVSSYSSSDDWDWRKCHSICEIWETRSLFQTFNAPFQIDLNNAFSKICFTWRHFAVPLATGSGKSPKQNYSTLKLFT